MRIALVTPPLVQLNTPYPAVPVLTKVLREWGHEVEQYDFSIDLTLKVFTADTLRLAGAELDRAPGIPDNIRKYFQESMEDYVGTVEDVVAFLQGRRPELAWRIANRCFLPEGPYFHCLANADDYGEGTLYDAFGSTGLHERAMHLASLYLDDVAALIAGTLDADFGLCKYAEALAVLRPDFEPILERLRSTKRTVLENYLDQLTDGLLAKSPELVGLAVPFPGTLLGAFLIAARIRERSPRTRIALGGGYVNSELRSLNDGRVFQYVDYICFDHGVPALSAILDGTPEKAKVLTADNLDLGRLALPPTEAPPSLLAPDYRGLELSKYLSVNETMTPLKRIWSDGLWIKMQLTYGCPWHRCKFCDLALDYIKAYRPSEPAEIVDEMERLMAETGHVGFHFTDESLPPNLLDALSREILRRGIHPVWWCNIRFEKSLSAGIIERMAQAGCIAVTGGLECACDRLLKLMNKGITLEGTKEVLGRLAEAGILVHAYLMYGFPTETEEEALDAMDFVRDLFQDGLLQSAYWHRFALTVHSPIAQHPKDYGIAIKKDTYKGPRFAQNEIFYVEKGAPDWNRIGKKLNESLYRLMYS